MYLKKILIFLKREINKVKTTHADKYFKFLLLHTTLFLHFSTNIYFAPNITTIRMLKLFYNHTAFELASGPLFKSPIFENSKFLPVRKICKSS